MPTYTELDPARDIRYLRKSFVKLLGHNNRAWQTNRDPLKQLLDLNGIYGFYADFIHLSEDDIKDLAYTDGTKISIADRGKLKVLLDFFHHESSLSGSVAYVLTFTKARFDEFRVGE